MRKVLLCFAVMFTLIGCGQESKITDSIEAQRTADAYGDGSHTVMPMVLPLSDDTIDSFDSPFSKVGFIFGGFTKIFADLGATIGMGKMNLSLTQKIPEIPKEYIEDVRFKRIFFYIEPVKGPRETRFWNRYLFGKDDVNFNFINRLAFRVETAQVPESMDWAPVVETTLFNTKKFQPMDDIFNEERIHASIMDLNQAKELVFLTFDKRNKNRYLKNDEHGPVYIINTSTPAKTRRFLSQHPKLEGVIERTHILNQSILVELKKDFILEEQFKAVMSEDALYLDQLGVEFIEACKPHTCFDFKVSNLNLMPILTKGNAITIDAFIEAGKVPESFQLKGFIEAEIRMKLTF